MHHDRREIPHGEVLAWLDAHCGKPVEVGVYFQLEEYDLCVLCTGGTLSHDPRDGAVGLYGLGDIQGALDVSELPKPLTVEVFEEGELEEDYVRIVLADRVLLVVTVVEEEADR